MKIIFYLSTCSTCRKILSDWKPGKDVVLQDIKTEAISPAQLDRMAKLAGGYEPLFSRRALKFRGMGLQDKKLTEQDYRKLILEEYTFLKRPVMILDNQLFIGSGSLAVAAGKKALRS